MVRTLLVVSVAFWVFSACEEPCVVVAGDCPNNCSGGPVAYGETCSGPSQCQCGLFCQGLTKTCTYYTGENRGCLCGGVSVSAPGLPVLGSDTHSMDNVDLTVIGTSSDGLRIPRDLEFNPEEDDELWVVNRSTPGDERMVVFSGASTGSASSKVYTTPDAQHFFAQPSAFAFGDPNEFASIHETNVLTQGPEGPGKDFMGPSLQSIKGGVFNAGGNGHLDMLHNSPLGMGIAWERDRVYWIFDGFHDSITKYDFGDDHGPGGTDHEDGIVHRYIEGKVKRKANVPSHMEFDPASSLLYIADSGNNRIATLDTTSGTLGSSISPNYDKSAQYKMSGATVSTLVDGAEIDMSAPSGLALHDGLIYVTDNETSKILAFDPIDGALIDWLDTELPKGSLMGIEFGTDGSLWLVDAVEDRILRITAKP